MPNFLPRRAGAEVIDESYLQAPIVIRIILHSRLGQVAMDCWCLRALAIAWRRFGSSDRGAAQYRLIAMNVAYVRAKTEDEGPWVETDELNPTNAIELGGSVVRTVHATPITSAAHGPGPERETASEQDGDGEASEGYATPEPHPLASRWLVLHPLPSIHDIPKEQLSLIVSCAALFFSLIALVVAMSSGSGHTSTWLPPAPREPDLGFFQTEPRTDADAAGLVVTAARVTIRTPKSRMVTQKIHGSNKWAWDSPVIDCHIGDPITW